MIRQRRFSLVNGPSETSPAQPLASAPARNGCYAAGRGRGGDQPEVAEDERPNMSKAGAKLPNPKSYSAWVKDVNTLHDEAGYAAWRIGYLRAQIGNADTNRAISGSYSGHALLISHYSVIESLLMFCARAWDYGHDTVSLRRCMESMPSLIDIYNGQISEKHTTASSQNELKVKNRFESFKSKYDKVIKHPAHRHVNAMRNEKIAHRIYECRDRVNSNDDIEPATLNKLIELSTETVKLISSLGLFCNNISINHIDRADRSEKYCRKFWQIIPRLADNET